MTSTTNARIAGSTFLLYIVAGIVSMVMFGWAVWMPAVPSPQKV